LIPKRKLSWDGHRSKLLVSFKNPSDTMALN